MSFFVPPLQQKENYYGKNLFYQFSRSEVINCRAIPHFSLETTTDYPFVVSDGPKANIHPLRNSKIKMGNDHDEDLVDYYDEDDDNDDSPAVAPLSDEADSSEYSESDSEGESGDSLDNVDTAPKLEDDSNVKQGPEETSGSGSGTYHSRSIGSLQLGEGGGGL